MTEATLSLVMIHYITFFVNNYRNIKTIAFSNFTNSPHFSWGDVYDATTRQNINDLIQHISRLLKLNNFQDCTQNFNNTFLDK